MHTTAISVIIPIYNEEKSIPILIEKLVNICGSYDYEIIAINDGSKDNSLAILKDLGLKNNHLKIINFKRNQGQTAAINAGIQHASKDILIFIDSDLENDPEDIPNLLAKLNEGYDVVSGWRKNRWKNELFTRKLPSLMANKLISIVSKVKLHDYGCTLKAYKKEVIENVILYGEMHRFIPVFCKWQGGKISEVPVNYQPRQFGKSNYGISRTFKVILDLILIKFFDKYINKPMHFFGGAGIISLLLGMLCAVVAIYYKVSGKKDFIQTPLPLMCMIFLVIGILFILMGILAELLMRTYYESQGKKPYQISEKINFIDGKNSI
ncbi:MAG: glycosyltransferase family 2 protein [Sediminibacterium sp.]|nr:glycosyltransferase family 2 protein [Sediminibacterium sp.]